MAAFVGHGRQVTHGEARLHLGTHIEQLYFFVYAMPITEARDTRV